MQNGHILLGVGIENERIKKNSNTSVDIRLKSMSDQLVNDLWADSL